MSDLVSEVTPLLRFRIKNVFLAGKYEDCLKLIETIPILDIGKELQITILKAACWANLGICHQEAVVTLQEVIVIDPHNPFAWYGVGLSYYMNGDFDKCIFPFSVALMKSKYTSKSTMKRADIYKDIATRVVDLMKKAKAEFEDKNFREAFEHLNECATVDVSNKRIKLAADDMHHDFLKRLIHSLEIDILYNNGNEEALLNNIERLIKSNLLEEAKKKLPSDGTSAHYYFVRGYFHYMWGFVKLSVDDFTKALELDPNYEEAKDLLDKVTLIRELIDYSAMLLRFKEFNSASSNLTNALEVDGENKRVLQAIYFQRAFCKYSAGMAEESFEDYMQFEALQAVTGMCVEGMKFSDLIRKPHVP